jgi:hypothetical protein
MMRVASSLRWHLVASLAAFLMPRLQNRRVGIWGRYECAPPSTVTLIAQTIDGAVVASSNSGGFTTYTVDLASYDLFPMLAVQPGQATLLTNPGEVEVYVDNNTQQLMGPSLNLLVAQSATYVLGTRRFGRKRHGSSRRCRGRSLFTSMVGLSRWLRSTSPRTSTRRPRRTRDSVQSERL